MESGMAGGRIIGSSARTPREEKPSKPFIPLPQLALPKTLRWKLNAEKLMSSEESIQGCISFKPLNYSSPGNVFLSPYFIMHFFTYYPGCNTERETWLSKPQSHHAGSGATRCQSECCIRVGETWASWPWHSPGSIVPRLMLRDHALPLLKSAASTDLGTSLMEGSGHWGVLEHQSVHAICS